MISTIAAPLIRAPTSNADHGDDRDERVPERVLGQHDSPRGAPFARAVRT